MSRTPAKGLFALTQWKSPVPGYLIKLLISRDLRQGISSYAVSMLFKTAPDQKSWMQSECRDGINSLSTLEDFVYRLYALNPRFSSPHHKSVIVEMAHFLFSNHKVT